MQNNKTEKTNQNIETKKEAIFAGGCFWCVESDFEKLNGVIEVISGYSGGEWSNPSYENYAEKGHIEVAKIIYNPKEITYNELLEHFWTNIDPLDGDGQFCDKGKEYQSAIFYQNQEEKSKAEKSKQKVSNILNQPVKTEIIKFEKFFPAEDYHQDFYRKSSIKYSFYRKTCGRDNRVKELWKDKNLSLSEDKYAQYQKPSQDKLENQLTPIQYKVTQKEGTEKTFQNEYWDNDEKGIYVDILSGEPLFSSTTKFKSGTGWPSFTKPINQKYIIEKDDTKLFMKRTEIKSRYADNHIGHVFNDGPSENEHPEGTGKRYCMNSAALKFIPKNKMKEKDYKEYIYLFE